MIQSSNWDIFPRKNFSQFTLTIIVKKIAKGKNEIPHKPDGIYNANSSSESKAKKRKHKSTIKISI
jgi:hypothetical protein